MKIHLTFRINICAQSQLCRCFHSLLRDFLVISSWRACVRPRALGSFNQWTRTRIAAIRFDLHSLHRAWKRERERLIGITGTWKKQASSERNVAFRIERCSSMHLGSLQIIKLSSRCCCCWSWLFFFFLAFFVNEWKKVLLLLRFSSSL